MKIVFDTDFDRRPWPGPLEGRNAAAGEAWVGEAGLLGLLETALGLAGPPILSSRRVATLVPAVRGTDGFWSASASIDPLAVSRRLLAWRDSSPRRPPSHQPGGLSSTHLLAGARGSS